MIHIVLQPFYYEDTPYLTKREIDIDLPACQGARAQAVLYIATSSYANAGMDRGNRTNRFFAIIPRKATERT